MIFEYALDPKLVCTWTDRKTCSFFKDQFGIEHGRLVSRYPKRWKKFVWNAYQKSKESRPQTDKKRAQIQREESKLTELLQRIGEIMIRRHKRDWNENNSWLNNALSEHKKCPFHAIITQSNPNNMSFILTQNDLYEENCPLWETNRGIPINRKAKDMANIVSPMLKNCRVAIFVDPYFRSNQRKWRRTFKEFFKELSTKHSQPSLLRIEVHASAEIYKAPSSDEFQNECMKNMANCIPKGLNVLFKRWKQKPNGEKLHNRYILTDIGGVSFLIGLDEGDKGETDDVTLLDIEQYKLRWSQYTSSNPAFDLAEEPFNFKGKWNG